MIGYVYILSIQHELDDSKKGLQLIVGFYIQYDDGQFVKSSIKVKNDDSHFYEKVLGNIQKYFKGDLRMMA